jgi:hypothetical protein
MTASTRSQRPPARAPDETARIKAEYHAARAAEKEFDAREPELGYEQFARDATA